MTDGQNLVLFRTFCGKNQSYKIGLIERCLKEIVINPHDIKGRTGQADEGQMKSQVNLWKQSFYYFFRRIHQKTWLGQNIFICINVRISKQKSCKTYILYSYVSSNSVL